jgi:hypothetical protein
MRKIFLVLLASCPFAGATSCFGGERLKNCDDVQLNAFNFPAPTLVSRAECQNSGAQLCEGASHSMGHRTTRQMLCYRNNSVVGGIRGTLRISGP